MSTRRRGVGVDQSVDAHPSGPDHDAEATVLVEQTWAIEATPLPSGRWCHRPGPVWEPVGARPFGEAIGSNVTTSWLGADLVAEAWAQELPVLLEPSTTPERRDRVLGSLVDRVLDRCARAGRRCLTLRSADLVVTPGDRAGTSVDFRTGEEMGLHVDNHERLPLGRRAEGFQVLGLSLGPRSRYFCFVDRTVEQMAEHVLGADEPCDLTSVRWLSDRYLASPTRHPVLRIGLPPGSAYLALTQDLLHDGAPSPGGDDHALLIGGWFE